MKKLMIVIHSLMGGGSERVAVNLVKGLDKKDFSITLILYERVFDYPLPENVEVIILDIPVGRNIASLTKGFILKVIGLAGLIKKIKPDIVFSLLSSTNVAVILAKLLSGIRCKVFASEHTHPSENLKNERYGEITKYFMRLSYPRADRIVAVSEGIKNDLIVTFNLPEEQITVIYNPIDIIDIEMLSHEPVDHPWFFEDVPILIAVGRLTKQKGYPYLIRAFSIVRRSLECRMIIVGKGEDRDKLGQLVSALGLEKDVDFIGFQKNPFKYMARSSIFILSSLREGLSCVIQEAMTVGLPVISTNCSSGPSEIIENKKHGILVPVGDENAMAEAITLVLKNEKLRKSLSNEARVRVQSFALNRIIRQYVSFFLDDSPSLSRK